MLRFVESKKRARDDNDAEEDGLRPFKRARRDLESDDDDGDEKMPQQQQQQPQPERKNPWVAAANVLIQHHANAKAELAHKNRPLTHAEVSCERLRPERKNAGDLLRAEFRRVINNMGLIWTAEQTLVIDAVERSLLRCFYGKDWEHARIELARTMTPDEISMIGKPTICNMPRQFGKSTVLRAIGAAFLATLPGKSAAVFSPGRRTSHTYAENVVNMLYLIPGARERIVAHGAEEVRVAANPLDSGNSANSAQARARKNDSTTSVLYSYPANEKGTHCVCVSRRWRPLDQPNT